VTYQLFVEYWPTATGPDAERMNNLPKIVFSRTLRRVQWNNARLAVDDGGWFEDVNDAIGDALRRLLHARRPGLMES